MSNEILGIYSKDLKIEKFCEGSMFGMRVRFGVPPRRTSPFSTNPVGKEDKCREKSIMSIEKGEKRREKSIMSIELMGIWRGSLLTL